MKQFLMKFASWTLWLNLLAMVVLVIALLAGVKWWLLKYTHHGEAIEVPDLYGMDFRQATSLLGDLGLSIAINDSTYIKEMAPGSVVVQSPASGVSVKEGRTVYVTITSLRTPRVTIPELTSYRQAEAVLRNMDLVLLPPKLIDGEKDWVYGIESHGKELHTGDRVERGTSITLVIGNGATMDDSYGDDDEYYDDDDDDDFEPVDPRLIRELP